MSNTSDPTLPNFVRPDALKVWPDLDLMADLLAGTRRIWERAQEARYLRKWAKEKQEVFDIRRQCETVFEGLARVLSACVGMLFAKPPAVVWNQSELAMREHWQNLDGMGTAGPVLAKRFSEQAIRDGLGLILVDHPPAPADVVVTDATARALALRPTWALYSRKQIVSWRTATINGALVLTQLVLRETTAEDEGRYGTKEVTRYRVLRLVPGPDGSRVATWELWRETKETGANGFLLDGRGVYLGMGREGRTRDTLPVGIAYTGRTDAPLSASLPLLGVAWANLSHWQIATDLRFARMIAAYAQPVVIGELAPVPGPNNTTMPGRIELGPLVGIHLVGTGASFDWKAPPVEAFAALERGVEEKLNQMGAQGAAFIVAQKRVAETAEAKRLDASAENSTLATAGQGVDDAWNLALEIHAWYLGIEKAGAPVMTINKDFDSIALEPQTMAVYVAAVKDAGLPPRILLEAWQQGGRLPPDADLDALEAQMAANAQAAADQAALEASAQADALAKQNGRQLSAVA
jgi:hypothetical protein